MAGILEGKRILVAGVTMDSSIGFATAKVAQEQGATVLISNFGRALGITRRIAKRLPVEPAVLELDVTDPDHLERLPELVREHLGPDAGLDGVVHSIAYGTPETLLGGKFLGGPWEDVAQAVQVSAYSLKSLATACRPLMGQGGSIVGLTFDATVAWPAYDWMGVAKAGLESCSRYLARDLGPEGIRVNAVCPGTVATPLVDGVAASYPVDLDARVQDRLLMMLPGPAITPDEIASSIVYLASAEARMITGSVVAFDGGMG